MPKPRRSWRIRSTLLGIVAICTAWDASAFAGADTPCNVTSAVVQEISLPASPFAAIPSSDGCTVYVSLLARNRDDRKAAVAALKRADGQVSVGAAVLLARSPTGMALTHDGLLLIVADGEGLTFLDTQRLLAGGDAELGRLDDGGRGAIYVAVTPDDRFAFVSDERSAAISVVNLQTVRASGVNSDAVLGQIRVGRAPVGLAVSADGRTLYATSEVVPEKDWPSGCKAEDARGEEHPQGAIFVIDVPRAETDPKDAVLQRIPAGCNPVRLALSPSGDRLYATARDSDALLVFDTAKLSAGAADAQIAAIPVGEAPVGVIAIDHGARIVVANSNRFTRSGRETNQTLTIVDATKIASGKEAVLGTVEVGGFPRELNLTADGKTLLVTNFGTNSLYLIDVANMPIRPR